MSKLNTEQPDLHICADVMHMNILSAAAKRLSQIVDDDEAIRAEKLEEASRLTQRMQSLAVSIENWTSERTGAWKPEIDDPRNIAQPQDVDESPTLPIPHFPCPRFLSYHDIWLVGDV